jgi:polar amino acid transport system ATP-binding protein
MIEATHLTKSFGGRTILDGVCLRVNGGEALSLTGPSGGGKSTFLRCLNGLEPFDAGAVRIADHTLLPGKRLHNDRALRQVRRRIGFVFQQWNLFAHRTALGNVLEGPLHVKGETREAATARAWSILERVGVAHRAQAYPHELSGGEQQRVAIARALAMEPDALLLDEPTSALDPARTGEVVDLLRGLVDGGLTLLVATHDEDFARALSARVVSLRDGKIGEVS